MRRLEVSITSNRSTSVTGAARGDAGSSYDTAGCTYVMVTLPSPIRTPPSLIVVV
jgi:hypothetical protein